MGDVRASSFRIETGGIFLGTSRMGGEAEIEADVVDAIASPA
jgi:hypothetical protein